MKRLAFAIVAIALSAIALSAQQSLSLETAYKVKQEAFKFSQMDEFAQWTTDYLGSRLVGSKQCARAELLMKEKMEEMGLKNARIEFASKFSKGGWDNVKTYAAMTSPYYCHFMCNPKAWSGSTDGLVKGEVVLIKAEKEEDLEQYKGKLKGKIVLVPPTRSYDLKFEPLAKRYTEEELAALESDPRSTAPAKYSYGSYAPNISRAILKMVAAEDPAVILTDGGEFNVPTSTSVAYKQGDPEPPAQIVLPVEDHGRMARLISNGHSVTMEVEIKNEFSKCDEVHNVIAEIPGTDPDLKDQVVLLGAHFDSWHGGTGAADNASGCIVMLEAMRIIKSLGISPRRTIRIALWGGEEQGLMGSGGYMRNVLMKNGKETPAFDNFALYLNMDNGSGMFRGIYLEENDMAFPFFEEWSKALEPLGFTILSPRRTSGTDHMIFQSKGLPAFQFIQDPLGYGRTYHTVMDTYERLSIPDLKHNAAVVAWIALNAAMDDGRIPFEPQMHTDKKK